MASTAPACRSARTEESSGAAPPLPKPLVRFVGSSLALALLLGVSTGAWTLFQMSFVVGRVLSSHVEIHGHVQILGFCGLFIAGISLFALPRVLGAAPPSARLQTIVLAGLGGGVFLRALGQPLTPWAAGRFLCLFSGALELGGALALGGAVIALAGAAARSGHPLARHAAAGGIYAVLCGALAALQALWLSAHPDPSLPVPLREAFSFVGLQGFALAFVYAFASRMVPVQLGLPPVVRWQRSAAILQALGVAAALGAFALCETDPLLSRRLEIGAYAAVAASAVSFVAASGLFRRSRHVGGPEGRWAVRLPVVSLLLWAFLTVGAVAWEVVTGVPAHHLVWDGARHLFTIGVLTLLIVVLGARIVPAFSGRRPVPAPVQTTAALLVALSAGLRLLEVPVGVGSGGPSLYRLAGVSGFTAFAGLAVFAGGLLFALISAPGARPHTPAAGPPLPVRP